MTKVIQFNANRVKVNVILENIHSVSINKNIETRVSATTVLNLSLEATLVDGKVLYVKYGDWDIVWSLYSHSPMQIKGIPYYPALIEMIERELTPVREELEESYSNHIKNNIILKGAVNNGY